MATFLTFCRTHSSNNVEHRTPWTYGEPYLSIVRSFLQLRYRLLPYFYTLSWEATQKGYPPVRPLFWSASDNAKLWDVEDAFLLGDALLVCPVVEEGGRMRPVILPPGLWYNFWDDTAIAGEQQVNLEAPLERIPLLVKAGSILPMEEDKKLILHIYPSVQDTSVTQLYSDAGDGYGASRLDQFHMMRLANGLEITWEEQGDYPFPYTSVQLHLHGIKPQQAWVDDAEVIFEGQKLQCFRFLKVRIEGALLHN